MDYTDVSPIRHILCPQLSLWEIIKVGKSLFTRASAFYELNTRLRGGVCGKHGDERLHLLFYQFWTRKHNCGN